MYSDIEILVQGFKWSGINNDYSKVNFFDTETEYPYVAFTSEINITPYVIQDSLSELTLSYETTEQNGKEVENYLVAGNMSFDVSDEILINCIINGALGNYYAHDIFQVYNDTSLIKYLCTIYYKNVLVFQGFINQDAIEEEINLSEDSKQISIDVVGMEKEFQEYFQNLSLSNQYDNKNLEIYWSDTNPVQYGIYWFGDTTYTRVKRMLLANLLSRLYSVTPATGYRCEVDISSVTKTMGSISRPWLVMEKAHVYRGAEGKSIWFHSGFKKIKDSDENCFDFLRKLCNSMGWCFSINYRDTVYATKAYLEIKDRYNISSSQYTINNSNLLGEPSFSIRKLDRGSGCDKVVLKAGQWDCAYNLFDDGTDAQHILLPGPRIYVVTDSGVSSYNTDIIDFFIHSTNYYTPYPEQIPFTRIYTEDDNRIRYQFINMYTPSFNRPTVEREYNVNKFGVLLLDGGEDVSNWRLDLSNKVHTYYSTNTLGGNDIEWRGNYGGMLYYQDAGTGGFNYYTYKDYVENVTPVGNQLHYFKYNLRTLLRGTSNLSPEVSVNEVVTNINQSVIFDNETGYFGGKVFSIKEMKVNFVDDITTMSLIHLLN